MRPHPPENYWTLTQTQIHIGFALYKDLWNGHELNSDPPAFTDQEFLVFMARSKREGRAACAFDMNNPPAPCWKNHEVLEHDECYVVSQEMGPDAKYCDVSREASSRVVNRIKEAENNVLYRFRENLELDDEDWGILHHIKDHYRMFMRMCTVWWWLKNRGWPEDGSQPAITRYSFNPNSGLVTPMPPDLCRAEDFSATMQRENDRHNEEDEGADWVVSQGWWKIGELA